MEHNSHLLNQSDKPELGKLLEYHKTLARHSVGARNPSTPEPVPGQSGIHRETLSQESKQTLSSSSTKKHRPTGWVRRLGLRVQERCKDPCCTKSQLRHYIQEVFCYVLRWPHSGLTRILPLLSSAFCAGL